MFPIGSDLVIVILPFYTHLSNIHRWNYGHFVMTGFKQFGSVDGQNYMLCEG